MKTVAVSPPVPTRRRLIEAALELFAEHGYEAVSVGDIESAAGLAPRAGGLYKHFSSKRALIESAMGERLEAIEAIEGRIELQPLGDLRAELALLARLGLDELERERQLARLVMKEGDRFPEIAAAFHENVVASGHRIARVWFEARQDSLGIVLADPDATAQVLTDSLVGFTLQQIMFGARLEAPDRSRLIAAWVELAACLIESRPSKE